MIPRTARPLVALALSGLAAAGCTTTASTPPTQVLRYHLDEPIARGTVAVQPATADAGGPAFAPWSAAVLAQLVGQGYTAAAPGTTPDFVAAVDVRQDQREGPPRRSPISIGIGAGGGSFGRGGGVGLGGGVGFPIGGGRGRLVLLTELDVKIKRRADQIVLWDGRARGAVELRAPDATAEAQAAKLAAALFTGFPGVSGRTVDVR